MKSCIVTTAFPRWHGDDRGIFIFNAAKAIQQQGINVVVVAIHSPGAKTREVLDGIEVIRPRYLPERLEILQSAGGGLPIVWKNNRLSRLAIIPYIIIQAITVANVARNCDLIHANWTLSGLIAWISKPFHSRPYIIMSHGSDIYIGGKTSWINLIIKPVIKASQNLVVISDSLLHAVNDLGYGYKSPIKIPETININNFAPLDYWERKNTILFVGSLILRKGVHILIEAFAEIHESIPDFNVVIIGEGEQEAQLKSLVETLGVSKKVVFVGACSPQYISKHMQKAKLFVLPSLEEGLGVVLLEACASGTPCIASDVGGIPDIIDAQTGFLFPPGDKKALSSAILKLVNDEELWHRISLSARQKIIDNFSFDVIGKKYKNLYTSVLNQSRLTH